MTPTTSFDQTMGKAHMDSAPSRTDRAKVGRRGSLAVPPDAIGVRQQLAEFSRAMATLDVDAAKVYLIPRIDRHDVGRMPVAYDDADIIRRNYLVHPVGQRFLRFDRVRGARESRGRSRRVC